MSWARVRGLTRSLGFRLNLWFGVLFVAGSVVLFSLIYVLLSAMVDRKDREIVTTRLAICSGIYQAQGLEKLREWLAMAHEARKEQSYFHRVNDRSGRLLLLSVPEHWEKADLQLLSALAAPTDHEWQRLARDQVLDLSVAAQRLPDGATMQVARRTRSRGELLRSARSSFALVLFPAIVLGVAMGAFVTRRLTAPLRQLGDAVREIIDTRKLEVRVPTRRADDELQDLIVLFNRMIEQNQGTLRMMKETLDNVAHDVRTPLARLRGIAESALHRADLPGLCVAPLEECITETERIQDLIQTLLEVARAEGGVLNPKLERVNLARLVEDAVGLYEDAAEEKGVALFFAPQRDCWTTVDPVRMRRVFANLLDNALKFTPSGGAIHVEVERENGQVIARIRDSGCGISEEHLPRVWERLFRADPSRAPDGLGLGLSLVKALVEANGGRVSARSRLGAGSEFGVALPAAAGAGEKAESPLPSRSPASATNIASMTPM